VNYIGWVTLSKCFEIVHKLHSDILPLSHKKELYLSELPINNFKKTVAFCSRSDVRIPTCNDRTGEALLDDKRAAASATRPKTGPWHVVSI
jgi:hypothetical protein